MPPKQCNAGGHSEVRQEHRGERNSALQTPCALIERTNSARTALFRRCSAGAVVSCLHPDSKMHFHRSDRGQTFPACRPAMMLCKVNGEPCRWKSAGPVRVLIVLWH